MLVYRTGFSAKERNYDGADRHTSRHVLLLCGIGIRATQG